MPYLTNLEWTGDYASYGPAAQKVLLALSFDKFKWRSVGRIRSLTGLDAKILDETLADLMDSSLVRPRFNKGRKIMFGLQERVG